MILSLSAKGKFEAISLPEEVQFAPILCMDVLDANRPEGIRL